MRDEPLPPLMKGDLITFTKYRDYMPHNQRVCTLSEDPEPADMEGGFSLLGVSINHFRLATPHDVVVALEELAGQIAERQAMTKFLLSQLGTLL